MRLNHDCVRDVLLTIEEELGLNSHLHAEQFRQLPRLEEYPFDDVLYTLIKLEEAGFINARVFYSDDEPDVFVSSLTYDGHQFLDNIRDNTVWRETKNAATKVASASLSILSDLAASIIKKTLDI